MWKPSMGHICKNPCENPSEYPMGHATRCSKMLQIIGKCIILWCTNLYNVSTTLFTTQIGYFYLHECIFIWSQVFNQWKKCTLLHLQYNVELMWCKNSIKNLIVQASRTWVDIFTVNHDVYTLGKQIFSQPLLALFN